MRWALRPDSGGAGEFRGGLGAIYEIELLEKDATVSLFGERGKFPPRGISGGLAALKNTFTYQGHNGYSELPFISKGVGVKLKYGERLQLETPGGGGFGSPFKRPLDLVISDKTAIVTSDFELSKRIAYDCKRLGVRVKPERQSRDLGIQFTAGLTKTNKLLAFEKGKRP